MNKSSPFPIPAEPRQARSPQHKTRRLRLPGADTRQPLFLRSARRRRRAGHLADHDELAPRCPATTHRDSDDVAALRAVTSACWGIMLAAGGGLATWSGTFYLPMPWWLATVLAAGIAGATVGWALESLSALRRAVPRAWTATILVLVTLGLVTAGLPEDIGFPPGTWAGVRDYRGKCLAGTEFTDAGAQLSITADVVTLIGSRSGTLRFTRTDDRWPSPGRAEIGGSGVIPRDRATRRALAAVGCS